MESNQNTTNVPTEQAGYVGYKPHSGFPLRGFPLKKIILILFAVLVFVGLLGLAIYFIADYAGLNEPKDITITYWGVNEDERVMKTLIDDYKASNPNVTVVYEKQDIKGLGKYVERLKTRINNDAGPDIYSFHSSWTTQVKDFLLVFPQDVVLKTQIDDDYYKTVRRDLNIKGGYYGLPLGVDTLALFVNSIFLENAGLQPPKEWNDIKRAYKDQLAVKDGDKIVISSLALGTYDNIDHAPDIIAMLLLQNGADIKKLNGDTMGKAVSAIDFYRSFSNPTTGSWNKTLDNSRSAFAKGSLAMYFGYSTDIAIIRSLNPNLQFKIVEAPKLIDIKRPIASYWAEGVSSKTKHKDEAFAFLEYLSKPATLQKANSEREKIGITKLPYPRKSMEKLMEGDSLLLPFALQADDAQTTFFASNTYDGENGMVTRMNSVLGDAVRSFGEASSSNDAVKKLGEEVGTVLSEYE